MAAPTPDQIPSPRGEADPAQLDPMARLVLSQVDGEATIADIARASGIPADMACRIAAALEADGLVAFPGSARQAGAPDIGVAADPEAEALEADVNALAANLGRLNYYEMLGVEPDSDRKAMRSAYFARSKRYHPDRAFGPRAAELRKKMEVIFTRLTRAYETLSDDEGHAAYDEYITEQIELWRIERQLREAADLSREMETAGARTLTPEPAAPTRTSTPAAVATTTRSSSQPARPRALVASIAPDRRPPDRSPAPAPSREDASARRRQWKKERMGRALGMVLHRGQDAPNKPNIRDLNLRMERATMAIEIGKHSEAVRILNELIAEGCDLPRTRELLKQAEAGATKELSLGYLRQARYERSHGDPEIAREHFEKALSIDPTSLDARHQLSEMLIERRIDLQRALVLSREVIGLGGQRAKYFVTLGEILLLSKDKRRAAEAFERALALEPENREIQKKLKVCKG